MCYYCQAATHNVSDTIPTYYWWWWGNEHKTHKYLAWNKANTSAALKQSAEVNRERQTAVGWKWCHFICHLTVSLWTAYSWGIHPCLVHLGAIARVPTQTHSNTHTHRISASVPTPSFALEPEMISKRNKNVALVFCFTALLLDTFAIPSYLVNMHVNMGAGGLFWPSSASDFTSVQEVTFGTQWKFDFLNDRWVCVQQQPRCERWKPAGKWVKRVSRINACIHTHTHKSVHLFHIHPSWIYPLQMVLTAFYMP